MGLTRLEELARLIIADAPRDVLRAAARQVFRAPAGQSLAALIVGCCGGYQEDDTITLRYVDGGAASRAAPLLTPYAAQMQANAFSKRRRGEPASPAKDMADMVQRLQGEPAARMAEQRFGVQSIDTPEFRKLCDTYHCAAQVELEDAYEAIYEHVDEEIADMAHAWQDRLRAALAALASLPTLGYRVTFPAGSTCVVESEAELELRIQGWQRDTLKIERLVSGGPHA